MTVKKFAQQLLVAVVAGVIVTYLTTSRPQA